MSASHPRLVVVGGGILGTMHAIEGARRGYSVVHLERDEEPLGASVRNFGLIWVSGRAGGGELDLALRARERWEEIALLAPGAGFRANGSITLARSEAELAVLEEAVGRSDARLRDLALMTPAQVRATNPAVLGEVRAGLWCGRDATVEPRRTLPALRNGLESTGSYSYLPSRQATEVRPHAVRDHTGQWHEGDIVVCCIGAWPGGFLAEALAAAPLRRVRLQMLETEPFLEPVTTSLADGDSLRYYPAFAGEALQGLPPQADVAARWRAQLLLVQRVGGELTIGDTHDYSEPFPFDVDDEPYRHLVHVAAALLGSDLPPVRRRWSGVYSQVTDDRLYYRAEVAPGVVVVTGPGGRGMTMAPAIAEETFL
ncbi:MAG: putative oxidoreductase [Acidimicrobiaceae bacterium]|nr:putative oxidoreductase [Acidimicrobiaceae bacterium]